MFEEIPTKMIKSGETPEMLGRDKFLKEVIKRQVEQVKSVVEADKKCIYIYDGSLIDVIKFISKRRINKYF